MKRKRKSTERKYRLKALPWERQQGRCYWCQTPMTNARKAKGQPLPQTATLDHLDSRLSPYRGKRTGYRKVLAHSLCNRQRGSEEVANLTPEERWARSGRPPR